MVLANWAHALTSALLLIAYAVAPAASLLLCLHYKRHPALKQLANYIMAINFLIRFGKNPKKTLYGGQQTHLWMPLLMCFHNMACQDGIQGAYKMF